MRRIVLKIGGSMLNFPPNLRNLVYEVVRLRRVAMFAIVPGGGPFADLVMKLQIEIQFDDGTAHAMAIKAMEVYGSYLLSLSDQIKSCLSTAEVKGAWGDGKVPLVFPYEILKEDEELPRSWAVTSDSIAVYLGRLLNADIVALAKVVGLTDESGGIVRYVKAGELRTLKGVADNCVLSLICRYGIPVALIDGRRPEALRSLAYGIEGDYTIIAPD